VIGKHKLNAKLFISFHNVENYKLYRFILFKKEQLVNYAIVVDVVAVDVVNVVAVVVYVYFRT
jgi:hypothetical protein